jgi:hypothetical protein
MDYLVSGKAPNVAIGTVPHRQNADGSVSPISAGTPMPVGGNPATDGSTTITAGGTAQNLFSGVTPPNGWSVSNPDSSEDLWVSDATMAAANGQGSIRVAAGFVYETPVGRKPAGAVSVIGATTGHKITASYW